MKIKIEVTKKHIENGIQSDETSCPIALALKEKGFTDLDVAQGGICATLLGDNFYTLDIPKKAQKFIERFDQGKKVQPFSFIAKD